MFKDAKKYDMNARSLAGKTNWETKSDEYKKQHAKRMSDIASNRKHSNESNAKRSAALKGRTPWNAGKKTGRKNSDAHKQAMIDKTRISIIYDGVEYPSYAAATRATGSAWHTIKKYAVEVDNT